ncbi:MarR family winged helix-turn-helix transcriptional regulator [Croceitalea rosinachiae]|uniref:MarR family transcriptional regulator n=1 Tax=Croceitalea rosinachiae TaxID=3075596 RepID=A0ABU3A9J2_9FLAO|nr:MarR family transcriptional regulator [Croceitalea sp. F388]MDT0606867.1 MarR family transcriptional regulator [Croceitalea sp. F388]
MNTENFASFNPSVCISNKVRQLNRVVANIYRTYLAPFNITDSQLTILFVLSKKEQLTQTELSNMLHLEKSSINRNLKRLLERNFITKKDFRRLALTTEGYTIVHQIIPEWEKAMHETEALLNNDGVQAVNLLTKKIN